MPDYGFRLRGAERCISGIDVRAEAYGYDASESTRRKIAGIVYPTSADEVQAIVQVANTHNIPFVADTLHQPGALF
jgi:FAD/FMN-containing dehydrogenase